VDPEPLVGVAADPGLDGGRTARRGGEDVRFGVGGTGERQLGAEVQNITPFGAAAAALPLTRFPDEKARQDCGVGLEGDAGQRGGGAGLRPEEGDEDALRRGHVGVHEDADGLAAVHGGEQAAGEVVLVQDAVAVAAAEGVDEGVHAGVVEAADDHAHGVAHHRVVEARELPRAQVAGEHQDALAAVAGGEVVFEAFVADELRGLLGGEAGHLAELGELPAERAVDAAQDGAALGGGRVGIGEGEVLLADAAQAGQQAVDEGSEGGADGAGGAARQQADGGDAEADDPVLEGLAEGAGAAAVR